MDESLMVAIVMVTAAVFAFELRISSAILEILAGITAFFFVDIGNLDWLSFLANLGMLGLMFMVGFEVDVERLRGRGAPVLLSPCRHLHCRWRAYLSSLTTFGLPILTAGLLSIGLSTTSLALVYNTAKTRHASYRARADHCCGLRRRCSEHDLFGFLDG